jgi:hypothetical protein
MVQAIAGPRQPSRIHADRSCTERAASRGRAPRRGPKREGTLLGVSMNLWQWWLLCGFPSFQIGINAPRDAQQCAVTPQLATQAADKRAWQAQLSSSAALHSQSPALLDMPS